jgi:hypothetical protein
MRPDHEQGFRVGANLLEGRVQPGEHVFKYGIRMWLAGIKNDVGEDGNHLSESTDSFDEFVIQTAHSGPELHAGHGELALKAALQVLIQADILAGAELEVIRDMNGVGCGLPIRKESAGRLKAHLMRDDPKSAALGDIAGYCFGEELSVENDNKLRLGCGQKGRELPGNIPGRPNELPQEEAGLDIIFEVVPPQNPS